MWAAISDCFDVEHFLSVAATKKVLFYERDSVLGYNMVTKVLYLLLGDFLDGTALSTAH